MATPSRFSDLHYSLELPSPASLLADVTALTEQSAALIGQEQLAQIQSLGIQNQSLNDTIREKDNLIETLLAQLNGQNQIDVDFILSMINVLLGQTNPDDMERHSKLDEIAAIEDPILKTKELIGFLVDSDKSCKGILVSLEKHLHGLSALLSRAVHPGNTDFIGICTQDLTDVEKEAIIKSIMDCGEVLAQDTVPFDKQFIENRRLSLSNERLKECTPDELRAIINEDIAMAATLASSIEHLKAELAENTEERVKQRLGDALRKEIEAEVAERVDKQDLPLLKENLRQQLRDEVQAEFEKTRLPGILEQMKANLSQEFNQDTLPQLTESIRKDIEDEFNRNKLPQLRESIRNEIEDEFAKSRLPQVKESIQNSIEEDLQQNRIPQLRESIRREVEDELNHNRVPQMQLSMRQELEDEFDKQKLPQLRESIRREYEEEFNQSKLPLLKQAIARQTEDAFKASQIPLLRSSIEAEFNSRAAMERQQMEEDIKKKVTSEMTPLIEARVRKEMVQQFEQNELPRIRQQIAEQKEREIRPSIELAVEKFKLEELPKIIKQERSTAIKETRQEEQLKAKQMEIDLRQKFETEEVPIIKARIMKESNTQQLEAIYPQLAQVTTVTQPYSFTNFVTVVHQVIDDVREAKAKANHTSSMVQLVSKLMAQNFHLEQLHTQTRALLVRQSEMISLIKKEEPASNWASWASQIYRILDVENEIPTDSLKLRLSIEEKVATLQASERMRSHSSFDGDSTPPILTPGERRKEKPIVELRSSPTH